MPTARFYVIQDSSNYASTTGYFELLAKLCGRLTEHTAAPAGQSDNQPAATGVSQQPRVSILTDEAMIARLDEALWSHPPTGFLPHRVLGLDTDTLPPAQIDLSTRIEALKPSVLINLSQAPVIHPEFTELVELVRPTEVSKERARVHFKAYKAQGYTLKHFTV